MSFIQTADVSGERMDFILNIWSLIKENPQIFTALVALLGGLVPLAVNMQQKNLDTKKELIARGYRTVISWSETPYRYLRQVQASLDLDVEKQKLYELEHRERLHSLQEEIAFFQGWMTAESKYLGRKYRDYVCRIKTASEPYLKNCEIKADDRKEKIAEANSVSKLVESDYSQMIREANDDFLKTVSVYMSAKSCNIFKLVWFRLIILMSDIRYFWNRKYGN